MNIFYILKIQFLHFTSLRSQCRSQPVKSHGYTERVTQVTVTCHTERVTQVTVTCHTHDNYTRYSVRV